MKNTLLLLGLIAVCALPAASEELTNMEAASRQYLINHGHSKDAAEMVEKSKAAATGDVYFNPYQKEHTKPVNWVINFFKYFDPAQDQDTFMRHDIKPTPSYEDL